VIDEANCAVSATALVHGNIEPLANGFLGHGLVRAQGNHDIQTAHRPPEVRIKGLEEQSDGTSAGGVGNNEYHPLVAKLVQRTRIRNQLGNVGLRKAASRSSHSR
jgi:hypothetical protein